MIVLSSYSTSWCQNEQDTIPSTGERVYTPDSVLISFNDLRKANAKMVELRYEKEINDSLRSIIVNDDKIIREYSSWNNSLTKQITSYKRQRNTAIGGGLVAALSLVISLIIK